MSNKSKFCDLSRQNYNIHIALIMSAVIGVFPAMAQRTADVSGRYEFYLGGNDNITIHDAKQKAIELAKAEALKNEFGMLVASDYINMDYSSNDDFSNFYMMDSSTSVKGEWLGDEGEPKVEIQVMPDGDLCFIAEVKGKAREIKRANTDLQWKVQKDLGGTKVDSNDFDSGERFFVNFKSPADGYVAIYLITSDNETACLLPYRQDSSGRVPVRAGHEYTFFDKSVDPSASYYKLSSTMPVESNQLVVLYSPNPFTKCTDTSKDPNRPNVLDSKDFAKWLLKAQRADNDLVVNKKWVKITGKAQ